MAGDSSQIAQLPVVIYGAGGHGRVVLDVVLSSGRSVLGFLDDAPPIKPEVVGLPVLGGAAWLAARSAQVEVVPGVGDNRARERVCAAVESVGARLASAVHTAAVVSRFARILPGAVVFPLAVVNAGASLGKGAVVNSGAVVEHDVEIGDYAHVAPNATLAGAVRVGRAALVGAGACVIPGVCVGDFAVVGAGAVVVRPVGEHTVVAGNPARMLRRIES